RRGIKVKRYVSILEQTVIDFIGPRAQRRPGAPGVYVNGAKIAALGIRVRHGRAYHGLSLNVDMDLSPFLAIAPCGYPGLAVTQLRDLGIAVSVDEAGGRLADYLMHKLAHACSRCKGKGRAGGHPHRASGPASQAFMDPGARREPQLALL